MSTVKVAQVTRRFKYQHLNLPDPGGNISPEGVKELYAGTYGELMNAAIDGPKFEGNAVVYEFVRAVRDKGV